MGRLRLASVQRTQRLDISLQLKRQEIIPVQNESQCFARRESMKRVTSSFVGRVRSI